MSETRVHLNGHPTITGTVIQGDEYCNKVTVKFDEGRTLRLWVDQLTWPPRLTYWLERHNGQTVSVREMETH